MTQSCAGKQQASQEACSMGEIGSVQIADNAGAIVDRLHEHLKSSKLARPFGSTR